MVHLKFSPFEKKKFSSFQVGCHREAHFETEKSSSWIMIFYAPIVFVIIYRSKNERWINAINDRQEIKLFEILNTKVSLFE